MKTDAAPDLAVTYEGMAAARDAIRVLERTGVEGHDITLLGDADAAALQPDNITRDERLISHVARSARTGAVIGAIAGAGLGLAAGALLFAWLSGAMWSAVGGGAFLGAGLGVLLGGIVRLPQSNAGLATIDTPHQGEVTVGISSPDPSLIETVERTRPTDVTRVADVPALLAAQRQAAQDQRRRDVPVMAARNARPADAAGAAGRRRPDPRDVALAGLAVLGLAGAVVSRVVWVRRRQ